MFPIGEVKDILLLLPLKAAPPPNLLPVAGCAPSKRENPTSVAVPLLPPLLSSTEFPCILYNATSEPLTKISDVVVQLSPVVDATNPPNKYLLKYDIVCYIVVFILMVLL